MVTAGRKRQRGEELSTQPQPKQARTSHARSRQSGPAQSAHAAQTRNRKGTDEHVKGSQGGWQAKEAAGKPLTPPAGGTSGAQQCAPDGTRAVRAAALAVAASAVSRGGLALGAARNPSPCCSTAPTPGLGVCHVLSSRDAAAAPSATQPLKQPAPLIAAAASSANQTLKQPAALIAAAANGRQGRAEGSKLGTQAGVRTCASRPSSIAAGPCSQQGSTQSIESQAAGLTTPGDPATGTAKHPLAATKQMAASLTMPVDHIMHTAKQIVAAAKQIMCKHFEDFEGKEAGKHGAVGQPAGASQLGLTWRGPSRPGKSPASQPASASMLGPTWHGPSTPGPVRHCAAGPAAGSSQDGITRQVLTQPAPVKRSAASQGSATVTQCETAGKPGSSKLGHCRPGPTVQGASRHSNGKPDAAGRRTDTRKLGAAVPAAGTGVPGASKPPRHAASGVCQRGHPGYPAGGAARAAAPESAAADATAAQPPPKPAAEAMAAGQHPPRLHANTVAMAAMVARRLTATAAAAEGGAPSGEAARGTRGSPSVHHQGPALRRKRLSRHETAAAEPATVYRCAFGSAGLAPWAMHHVSSSGKIHLQLHLLGRQVCFLAACQQQCCHAASTKWPSGHREQHSKAVSHGTRSAFPEAMSQSLFSEAVLI